VARIAAGGSTTACGGVDGVENVTGNDFIVPRWHGTIYYVKGDGTGGAVDTHEQKINSADTTTRGIAPLRADFQEHRVAYDLKRSDCSPRQRSHLVPGVLVLVGHCTLHAVPV
jgi:hypothetical protein